MNPSMKEQLEALKPFIITKEIAMACGSKKKGKKPTSGNK